MECDGKIMEMDGYPLFTDYGTKVEYFGAFADPFGSEKHYILLPVAVSVTNFPNYIFTLSSEFKIKGVKTKTYDPGEVTAFTLPNNKGKTTLLVPEKPIESIGKRLIDEFLNPLGIGVFVDDKWKRFETKEDEKKVRIFGFYTMGQVMKLFSRNPEEVAHFELGKSNDFQRITMFLLHCLKYPIPLFSMSGPSPETNRGRYAMEVYSNNVKYSMKHHVSFASEEKNIQICKVELYQEFKIIIDSDEQMKVVIASEETKIDELKNVVNVPYYDNKEEKMYEPAMVMYINKRPVALTSALDGYMYIIRETRYPLLIYVESNQEIIK